MIPVDLQEGLKERLEALFREKSFENPDGEMVPLSIFEQHLPEKDKEDFSFYPYIIVQLQYGQQQSSEGQHEISITFIVGVYDEDPNNQGHKELVDIMQTLFENLENMPIQNGLYEVNFPMKWGFHDEDLFPYYFGAIETNWIVPTNRRKDVEALI